MRDDRGDGIINNRHLLAYNQDGGDLGQFETMWTSSGLEFRVTQK